MMICRGTLDGNAEEQDKGIRSISDEDLHTIIGLSGRVIKEKGGISVFRTF